MTKDVLVSISGFQFDVDENEPIELVTAGTYYNKNGKHYIIYEECSEDDPKTIKNTIKLGEHTLEMIKHGSSNVHMVFEEGKTNMTYYDTPVGSLLIGINTESIRVKEEETHLSIRIRYSLDVNYTHVSNCEIQMEVKSKTGMVRES